MAGLMVIDVEEQTRVPYLRGILTRSLRNAGLEFDKSYDLATRLRAELGDAVEVTNVELRERVQRHLQAYDAVVAERYAHGQAVVEAIQIVSDDGDSTPYSRGRQRMDLMSSGLSGDEAFAVVAEVYRKLAERGRTEVEAARLGRLTRKTIRRSLGAGAAERFDVWQRFSRGNRPLIVLVGGTVGTGKSTVSTALAQRLGIVRIQSTDMLREVMRALVPEDLLPALFKSTYTAWEALPGPEHPDQPSDMLLAEGYLAQTDPVTLANDAVIKRSLKERLSLILEGVHVHPRWVSALPGNGDAIVVPIMLAVLSRKKLKKRLKGRGRSTPDRRAERYLANLDAIWQLQSFLLSEADDAGVPIVFNEDLDSTVQQAMGVVLDALSHHLMTASEHAG